MSDKCATATYSTVDGLEIKIDIYTTAKALGKVPGVIYFHGGGLLCGSRDDFLLPAWLKGTSLDIEL
jgi:acetyl esterase/lipase